MMKHKFFLSSILVGGLILYNKFVMSSILVGGLILNSCSFLDTTHIDLSTYINIPITIFVSPDTTSGHISSEDPNPMVIFCGTVKGEKTNDPQSGVEVRIVGTDTPGGMVYTNEKGSWQMELPIAPNKNNEIYTMFVIEAKKEGAKEVPISNYSHITNYQEICNLLGVKDPNEYKVSGLCVYNVEWENLYKRTECPMYIKE